MFKTNKHSRDEGALEVANAHACIVKAYKKQMRC